MTPDQLAKSNSEHGHQRALFAWANMAAMYGFAAAWDDCCYGKAGYAKLQYGECDPITALRRLYAIPNGGKRDKITAGMLKAEGVKPGVPDIMLPLPWTDRHYCGLYVEMKRPKATKQIAGSTSSVQDDWIAHLRSVGYAVSVCFDWRSAAKEIQSYIEASGVYAEPQST